jgi:hypothetical protein
VLALRCGVADVTVLKLAVKGENDPAEAEAPSICGGARYGINASIVDDDRGIGARCVGYYIDAIE